MKIIGTIESRRDPDRYRFSCRRAPLDRYRGPWRKNPVLAEADRAAFMRNTVRALSLLIERFAVELLEDELARADENLAESA